MQKKSAADEIFMARALELARKGEGHTRPNPPVGAVIVRDGEIVGEGWHRKCGCDHAEVAALRNAAKRGKSVRGGCIYVTLEPCSRPGRVGACTDAIAGSGLSEVVFACRDPNPANRGRAKRILAGRGIKCRQFKMEAAERLIAPFAKHVTTGMPFVTVKIAMSLDGRICDNEGGARWISSPAARKKTGSLRRRVDAVLIGAGTLRADDPVLLPHEGRNDDLLRVVVTKSGRLPAGAKLFADGRNETAVYKIAGKSGLKDMLGDLGRRGIMHVLCEGGLKTAVSLAEEGLVDEWIGVFSPCLIGSRKIGDKVLFKPAGADFSERAGCDMIARYVCLRD